jgi:small nuclear ribonucleoprotein (snRNP)-like protein
MPIKDWEKDILDRYVQRAHGTTAYEILGSADMLWSGWELDTAAVLIRLRDGRKVWAILNSVDVKPSQAVETLQERLEAYRHAIEETETLLRLTSEL